MLSEQEMIKLMIYEPSWEDVIVKIVAEEGMDPWNIDIIRLADSFTKYLSDAKEADLRIPARFILVAAILVRMKSDVLVDRKEPVLIAESEQKDNPLLRILAQIPPLEPPIKRQPMSSVTMTELLTALKKAFDVQERRSERKAKLRRAVERVLPVEETDINKRIETLLEQIQHALSDIEKNTTFKKLVTNWQREDIVRVLMPMLHLSQEGRIEYDQPILFDEIFVKMRKDVKNKQEGAP